ncbi:hypothetical protein Q8A73_018058 [Channa argus]|nr:hypothetical protein Q8A73_018058 [Channa argus]
MNTEDSILLNASLFTETSQPDFDVVKLRESDCSKLSLRQRFLSKKHFELFGWRTKREFVMIRFSHGAESRISCHFNLCSPGETGNCRSREETSDDDLPVNLLNSAASAGDPHASRGPVAAERLKTLAGRSFPMWLEMPVSTGRSSSGAHISPWWVGFAVGTRPRYIIHHHSRKGPLLPSHGVSAEAESITLSQLTFPQPFHATPTQRKLQFILNQAQLLSSRPATGAPAINEPINKPAVGVVHMVSHFKQSLMEQLNLLLRQRNVITEEKTLINVSDLCVSLRGLLSLTMQMFSWTHLKRKWRAAVPLLHQPPPSESSCFSIEFNVFLFMWDEHRESGGASASAHQKMISVKRAKLPRCTCADTMMSMKRPGSHRRSKVCSSAQNQSGHCWTLQHNGSMWKLWGSLIISSFFGQFSEKCFRGRAADEMISPQPELR